MEESLRQSILEHNMKVLHYLTMQPGTVMELALGLFIGITVLTIVIAKVHILSKTGTASLLLTLFSVILCSFLMIEVASFTKIWLIPRTGLLNIDQWIVAGAVGLAFLFLVVPFTRALLHGGYFTSMTAWILGLLVTCGALYLFSLSYKEPRKGTTPIDTLDTVKEQVEQTIKNQKLIKRKNPNQ